MSSESNILPCPKLNSMTWIIIGIALLIFLALAGIIAWLAYSKSKLASTSKNCPSTNNNYPSIPTENKCLIDTKTFADSNPQNNITTFGNLTDITQNQCQNLCLALDDCQAWTHKPTNNQCYLRTTSGNAPTITTGFNAGDSDCAPWTRYPSSDFSFNGVAVGTRTAGVTETDCQQQCLSATNCDFYTFNTADNSCNVYQMSANDSGATTGIRLQVSSPS